MIIHLTGSIRKFDEDLPVMKTIATIIKKSGGLVALNWVDGVHDRKARGSILEASLDWGEIVESNVDAITRADALVLESSRFNYSQGYQTAIALQQNKPVLNLYREDLPEYKEWPDKFFVSGVSHPLFVSKAYKNEKELEKIVMKFLKDHAKKTHELDIKIALDNKTYTKLDQLAQETGRSKNGVIKDILSQKLK